MDSIAPISENYANSLTEGSSTNDQTLGKDDFLKLLVAQMENQDPMNPTDPTEFTAQLSQFSSLEQLYNINDNIGALQTDLESSSRMSSLNLIGKSVMSASDSFQYQGETVQLGYEFQEEMDSAILEIQDGSGNIVNSIDLGAPEIGEHFVEWDGTDWFGNTVSNGTYSFDVNGYRGEEKVATNNLLVQSTITGVDLSDSKNTILMTSNGEVKLSDVNQVFDN